MESYFTLRPILDNGYVDYWINPNLRSLFNLFIVVAIIYIVGTLLFNRVRVEHAMGPIKVIYIYWLALFAVLIFGLTEPAMVYPEGYLKVSYQRNEVGEERYCLQKVILNHKIVNDNRYQWKCLSCMQPKEDIYKRYRELEERRKNKYKAELMRIKQEMKEKFEENRRSFKEVSNNL